MPKPLCWFLDLTTRLTYSPEKLLKSLQHLKLRLERWTPDLSPSMGCIFFDSEKVLEEFWDNHADQVRQSGRVFGIAMKPQLLGGYRVQSWLRAGFSDLVSYTDSEDLASMISRRFDRWRYIESLLEKPYITNHLVGNCPSWKKLLRELIEISCFSNLNVLILGESGTGKEMISRMIHEFDSRKDKGQFVVVDCTTIVPELAGSELFGHEKGAFTNAIGSREGAFALAHKGTLFLDEIGELPPGLQAELLRVVQEGVYKKVGSNHWEKTDFRLVCATNKDLGPQSGNFFRMDLFYRISGWTSRLPGLAERRADIPLLVEHFLYKKWSSELKVRVDPLVIDYLCNRSYPGNVRELQQLVHRMAAAYTGKGVVTWGCLPPDEWLHISPDRLQIVHSAIEEEIGFGPTTRRALQIGMGLKEIKEGAAQAAIAEAVKLENGNLQNAAKLLGVTDRTLQLWRASNRQVS